MAILVGGLKCRIQFWKGTTQGSFQQSLAEIGSVVSEEKIFFKFHPPHFSIFSLVAILVGSRDHRTQFWKGATQGPFHQSLVAIGPVVSEEKIKMWKANNRRRTKPDGKSSHGLWPGELKKMVESSLKVYITYHVYIPSILRNFHCFLSLAWFTAIYFWILVPVLTLITWLLKLKNYEKIFCVIIWFTILILGNPNVS